MIKTQMWMPDTHPGLELHTEWDYPDDGGDGVFVRCFSAVQDGEELSNPDQVHALVIAEHQRKGAAESAIFAALPDSMKRAVLDSDGDETGDIIIKDKHRPVWSYGAVDGAVSVSIPGASDAVLATVREALAGFGDAVTVA